MHLTHRHIQISSHQSQLLGDLTPFRPACNASIIAQDVALDEDEDEEDDQEEDLVSESEDEEDAFDADEAGDEDGHLGDDEDADGEVDDAYIKRLERESRRLKVCCRCK